MGLTECLMVISAVQSSCPVPKTAGRYRPNHHRLLRQCGITRMHQVEPVGLAIVIDCVIQGILFGTAVPVRCWDS